MDQTRWILAGIGAVIIALIYLWGMRSRIQEELRRRRRARLAENEPFLEISEPDTPPTDAGGYGFNKFASISTDHPLAKEMLVDVEIKPVDHSQTDSVATEADDSSTKVEDKAEQSALDFDFEFAPDSKPSEPVENPATDIAEPAPTPAEPPPPPSKPVLQEPKEPGIDQQPNAAIPRQPPKEPGIKDASKMTVLLTIMANPRKPFKGEKVFAITQTMGMTLHKSGVIDCYAEAPAAKENPVFSIAHLREPGTFDEATLDKLTTPGLLILMELPGPLEPLVALNFMLSQTHELAEQLSGHICDEHRNRMTNQRLGHLRGEVIEFERQQRLQKPRY